MRIDLHSHLLPGLDDGAVDVAESLAMAQKAVDDGIRVMAATPHSLKEGHSIDARPDAVASAVGRLQAELDAAGLPLRLIPGAEVHLRRGMAAQILAGDVCTLNDGGVYVLTEFPVLTIPDGAFEELFLLLQEGITPIITHPERHAIFQLEPQRLCGLIEMGCLVQVTAMSITGEFGRGPMEAAHAMIARRMAHLIATDAHSADQRPPRMGHAVAIAGSILGSLEEADLMVSRRPAEILEGKRIDAPDVRSGAGKKGWAGRLRKMIA